MRPRLQQLIGLLGRAVQSNAPEPIKIRRLTPPDSGPHEQIDPDEFVRRIDESRERLKQQIPPPAA